jgi:hypothetical protein
LDLPLATTTSTSIASEKYTAETAKHHGTGGSRNEKSKQFLTSTTKELKCIRPVSPATKEEVGKRNEKYLNYDNTVRLHSTIERLTPTDCLAGISEVIGKERSKKLEAARKMPQEKTGSIETSCLTAWKRLQQTYLRER